MSKFQMVTIEQAQGKTAELYKNIKAGLGSVPNIFLTLGINPRALEIFLGIGGGLKDGLLTGAEQEAIALTVSQMNDCHYCVAAHTVLGKMNGLSESEIKLNRKGESENNKIAALVGLVHEIVAKKGFISDNTFNNFKAAGYTDAHVPEVLLSIMQSMYTNYFNNLNDTKIDFPAAPDL